MIIAKRRVPDAERAALAVLAWALSLLLDQQPTPLAAAVFGWFASSECGPEPFDSKDAGLYQSSPVGQDGWYHVATLHGWADNFEVCREIVLGGDRKPHVHVSGHRIGI